ncbi:MAG TPA: hypothetical protein VG457_04960, partial [Planctomycetota bacterium]|nr:hypothetical protein [Planctomycetota bacterium]
RRSPDAFRVCDCSCSLHVPGALILHFEIAGGAKPAGAVLRSLQGKAARSTFSDGTRLAIERGTGGDVMNLALWLPLMFVFGLLLLAFCYWFLTVCEKV